MYKIMEHAGVYKTPFASSFDAAMDAINFIIDHVGAIIDLEKEPEENFWMIAAGKTCRLFSIEEV